MIENLPVVNPPIERSAALIDHLARRFRAGAEAVLDPLGLRSRHFVTLTLLRDRGEGSQQSLASVLRMDRTNLVGLLNDLEAIGLIERRRAPDDRRRHIVAITDEGRRALAKAEFALTAVEDEVLGALDAAQRSQLFALLQLATSGDHPDDRAARSLIDGTC